MTDLTHFTDREDQIAAFDALWESATPWILVFCGVSGNGKSTLIEWLIEFRCRPAGMRTVKIDCSHSGGLDLPGVLNRLAELLSPGAGRAFRRLSRDAQRQSQHSAEMLARAQATRPIQVDMTAPSGGRIVDSHIHVHGSAIDQEALRQAYHAQLISAYRDHLDALRPGRTVLFFDAFEHAQDNTSGREMGLFWALLEDLHRANPALRVIIGGQEDLALPSARAWRRPESLDPFSEADSDALLRSWSDGQMTPELRRAIFELAQGHPLLTEMAAQLWRDGL